MANKELDTEFKIKEAARIVFQEKGFNGTKTRDIAEAADINVALLNYYFRSKKKLFDIIMTETLQSFFSGVIIVFNDENTTLRQKVSSFVDHYIALLSANPNIAPFILNTIRNNPDEYIAKIGMFEKAKGSVFLIQFKEGILKGDIPPINPVHFMINLVGLVVFPFIAQPMISAGMGIPKESLFEILQERKRLIPLWIDSMLNVT